MQFGIPLFVSARKICKAVLLGFVTLAMVIPGSNVAFSQSGAGRSPKTFTTIDFPGSAFTNAFGINNVGQIVGTAAGCPQGCVGSFLRDAAGAFTDILILLPNFNSMETITRGINDAGQIVGWARNPNFIGFLRDAGGAFTTFDVHGATGTAAFGINDAGQIVGLFEDVIGPTHGFLRDAKGTFTTIDGPNSTHTEATGINDAGQVVGVFVDVIGLLHGFLRDAGGKFTTIDVLNSTRTQATGINNAGQIVGIFDDASGTHGFLRDAKTGTFTTIDGPNSTHTEAWGINDAGQIVGWFVDPGGNGHGFLAVPVPGAVPVIILPGVPGSWPKSSEAFQQPGGVKKILTITKDLARMFVTHLPYTEMAVYHPVYDDLINALKSKGIAAFPMPYDWANGGYQKAAADLGQFIRDHNFDKVDIIAHSAGGLVALQYIEDRLNASADPRVRNLILLGSVNEGELGAHCAYYVEPLACAPQDDKLALLQSALFQLLLNSHTLLGVPSLALAQLTDTIAQAMPIFPYLKIPFLPLFTRYHNTYLERLHTQTLSEIGGGQFQGAGITPYTVRGTGVPTPGTFVVIPNPDPLTGALRPFSVVLTDRNSDPGGDGSVLARSAGLFGPNSAPVPGVNDVPVPNATHIAGLLSCIKEAYPSLRDTGILACSPQGRRASTYVHVQILSPVRVRLVDPRGRLTGTDFATGADVADIPTSTFFDSDHPGIFIDEAVQGKYTVDVLGTGNGGTFGLAIAFPNAFPNGFDITVENFSGAITPGQHLRFAFDTFAFQGVTNHFASFKARLEINSASKAFEIDGTFTPVPGGTISPLTQPVTIQLGNGFLVTIPAGSFRAEHGRRFVFEGIVNDVALEATLEQTGRRYSFNIEGAGAPSLPDANPVEVRLGIGNTGGSVSVEAEFN